MRLLFSALFITFFSSSLLHAEQITEADLRQHIAVLASDEFEGRNPGTEGENKTVNYIASEWSKAELQPAGSGGSWYEPVALVERKPTGSSAIFSVDFKNRQRDFAVSRDNIVLQGRGEMENISAVPVVFAGYANENASELRRLISGKIALLHLRKPMGRDDLPDYRNRKKQLIQAGAAAVISIVAGEGRWNRMKRFVERGSMTLDSANQHATFDGIIRQKYVRKLLKKAGLDKRQFEIWQDDREFRAFDLPMRADMFAETDIRKFVSHNVVGKIPGSKTDSGAVLFLGHWDHFGKCRKKDPENPEKDRICNGAVDNASGIALLIETAKRLTSSKPDRDIYFLATTAEERGLLGAYAFVENPPTAIENFIAAFNADSIAIAKEGTNIAVVGLGETELDPDIEKVANKENRKIDRSGKPNAYLKRQDGYVFLEQGIPAYMITSAFADEILLNAFIDGAYHDVSDELDDDLPLGGAAADANFHVALGRYFGSTETFPQKASGE
ncbi:MAG: M20/M25/M40 family metallo-hydrolase [Parasphingorhabdus sp.]